MPVDLYDSHYGQLHAEAQRQVREETYDEDLGQASWLTLEEYQRFLGWLDIGPESRVLEVACGSGGVSVRMARDTGAEVVGVLRDWHRLLRPAGKVLYTDPIVVTGWLSNEEIAMRSSIGFFLFVPVGENERLLKEVGFELLHVEDVTENVVQTSERWHAARQRRRELLVQFEGEDGFEGVQRFLEVVHRLSSARRLSRFAFLSRRPV